jgi:hypothetical protein
MPGMRYENNLSRVDPWLMIALYSQGTNRITEYRYCNPSSICTFSLPFDAVRADLPSPPHIGWLVSTSNTFNESTILQKK